MSIREISKYVFGLVLAAILMIWVFRGTDARTLWGEIRQASIPGLLFGGALNLGHNVFRVFRWKVLLAPVRRGLGFRGMFAAVIVGYMTSWVVPGRLGELVRPMLVSAREGIALGPVVGSVVVDRVLDLVSVAFVFAIGLWITPLPGGAIEHASLMKSASALMTAGSVLVLVAMVAMSVYGDRLAPWFARRGRVLRWIGRAGLSLAHGAGALRSLRSILAVLALGLAAWLTIVFGTWICIRSAGADVSIGAVMIILPMLVIGVAVPTPGGAGSYHGAMKAGLLLFGVPAVSAVSAGLLTHAVITIPIIVVGVLMLWTENMRWSELVSGARQFRHLGSEPESRLEGVS
jgi:uncharacterized protein (TIRG00374 family)